VPRALTGRGGDIGGGRFKQGSMIKGWGSRGEGVMGGAVGGRKRGIWGKGSENGLVGKNGGEKRLIVKRKGSGARFREREGGKDKQRGGNRREGGNCTKTNLGAGKGREKGEREGRK